MSFNPVILNIKKSPSHAVGRSVKQVGLTQVRGQKGDERNSYDWNIGWVDKCSRAFFESLQFNQKVNHLLGVEQLSKKKNLARTMNPMVELCPEEYSFMPRSWNFSTEKEKFITYFNKQRAEENERRAQGEHVVPRTYIVKPGSACQGRGIYLVQDLEDITPNPGIVVQEYIANPLLIKNKKFDLRIYVAVTSAKPLRMYLYQDGLARFCTEDYVRPDMNNLSALFGHLTNYSLNKMNENAENTVTEEEALENQGFKWTLQYLNQFLSGIYGAQKVRKIWTDIQHLMVKTMIAALPIMQHAYSTIYPTDHDGGHGFQLFGFDVMLDENLKPWLIEVNRNPSLRCDTTLDQKIKTFLLDQLFYIVDPVNSTVPPQELRASVNRHLGISKDQEERFVTITSSVQAQTELDEDDLQLYNERRRILQLQTRLQYEDIMVSRLLGVAVRHNLALENNKSSSVVADIVDGPNNIANIYLKKDAKHTDLPSFATAWQRMYPVTEYEDYPLPPTADQVEKSQEYDGYLAQVKTQNEQELKKLGINLMYSLLSVEEQAQKSAEFTRLTQAAMQVYRTMPATVLSEALNSKMGLGGAPTAPWTMNRHPRKQRVV